jgi:redox-sensitive bicupin YhaK (pirin superfamily)
MLEFRPSSDRGTANFGWLYSRHTFSFGSYRDLAQQGFSDLLVINEDRVQPGEGFGTHPHKDMEIFSYVLAGALEHRDSMGTGSVIRPGDVQMMSAGTGITHSEFNPSPDGLVHFLQVWLVPDRKGVKPRYQQKRFDDAEKRGRLRLIISPGGSDGSLSVHQDARVYAGLFDQGERETLVLPGKRFAYLHVARGSIEINGQFFSAGDGARVLEEREISLYNGSGAEVLLFDLRPNELPRP